VALEASGLWAMLSVWPGRRKREYTWSFDRASRACSGAIVGADMDVDSTCC